MPLRRVLVLVSAIVLLDVLFYSAIAPLLPWYAANLHLTKSQAGLLSGSYALGTLLGSLPAGWIAAHRGTRPTLLLGLALMAAASIAFGVGTSFPVLVAARLVQGVAGAAAWAAALAWLVEVAPASAAVNSSGRRWGWASPARWAAHCSGLSPRGWGRDWCSPRWPSWQPGWALRWSSR